MKFLSFSVIFSTLIYLSNQADDYRMSSIAGEKIPIYTGLYYGVINKRSGYGWVHYKKLLPSLDPKNASHWSKFEKSDRVYKMSTGYYYKIQKVDENYYRLSILL
jgi:hypothetical protein